MKCPSLVSTVLLSVLAGTATVTAQSTRIVSPTPHQRMVAGQQFTATVAFADTTSSVNVLALAFGAKALDPQDIDLGQTLLGVSLTPTFQSGQDGLFVHQVNLTWPSQMINGLDREYNLTLGEFFLLGAENTASTLVSQVPIFVASS